MRAWLRRGVAVAVVLAGLGLVPGGGQVAQAAEPRTVLAGWFDPDNKPYEFTQYYPSTLQIHQGATVSWEVLGFHTVTFLEGDDPAKHRSLLRGDDLPGFGAVDVDGAFVDPPNCGWDDQAPCAVNSVDDFLSSGFGGGSFSATINLAPRAEAYRYHCAIHPSMHGFLQVVPDAQAIPSQATIDSQAQSSIAAHTALADQLVEDGQTTTPEIGPNGERTWNVRAGDSTAGNEVAVLAYLPGNIQAEPGDRVRFRMDRPGLRDEMHTVSFSPTTQGTDDQPGIGWFGFTPACDLDEVNGGLPSLTILPQLILTDIASAIVGDVDPELGDAIANAPVCPGTFEVLLSPFMMSPHPSPGSLVLNDLTNHDSGLMAPADAPLWLAHDTKGGRFPSTFDAVFPVEGEFSYFCNFHGAFMSGGVQVG